MNKIITLFAICIMAIGCEKKPLDGDCSPVVLSPQAFHFEKQGGSIKMTTNHKHWWMEGISESNPQVYEVEVIREENEGNNGEILEIKSDWFVIKKETSQTLSVQFEPNPTGNERWIKLGLQAGDCFTTSSLSQSAE